MVDCLPVPNKAQWLNVEKGKSKVLLWKFHIWPPSPSRLKTVPSNRLQVSVTPHTLQRCLSKECGHDGMANLALRHQHMFSSNFHQYHLICTKVEIFYISPPPNRFLCKCLVGMALFYHSALQKPRAILYLRMLKFSTHWKFLRT